MSRYSLDLNEKKSSSKTNLYIFIGVFVVSLILIFSIGYLLKHKKTQITPKKTITKVAKKSPQKQQNAPKVKSNKIEKKAKKLSKKKIEKPVKKHPKKIVKKTKLKPKKYLKKNRKTYTKKKNVNNILFKNDLNGAKISGVALAKGISPTVFIKQNGSTKTYHIGDKFENYTIKEIHRTYILVVNGAKVVHLNYLQ